MWKKKKFARDLNRLEITLLVLISLFFSIFLFYISEGYSETPKDTFNYTVQKGDTLWNIAERFCPNSHTGRIAFEIEKMNNVKDFIHPGEVLMVPVEPKIFEATAYTLHEGSGCGLTKTGTVPKEGRTVAVDPKVIKLGSELIINGTPGYIAEDTGGSIKGKKLDIYMVDRKEALKWGRQKVEVVVINK